MRCPPPWVVVWRGLYMASNSSIRCLVLPCLICRSVLYLSRPCRMFSLWMMSLWVLLFSSRAWDNSLLRVCNVKQASVIHLS